MFELPWIAFFVLLSPWWWVLMVLASCLLIYSLERQSGQGAAIILIGTLLLMTFFGEVQWLKWIAANPLKVLSWIGIYIVSGAIWGVVKWFMYVSQRSEEYESEKLSFLKRHNVEGHEVPVELKRKWRQHLLNSVKWTTVRGFDMKSTLRIQPVAWENKGKIVTWMTYWPWSLLWAVTNDMVQKVFRTLQRWLGSFMDRISAWVFRGTEKDYDVPEEDKK